MEFRLGLFGIFGRKEKMGRRRMTLDLYAFLDLDLSYIDE